MTLNKPQGICVPCRRRLIHIQCDKGRKRSTRTSQRSNKITGTVAACTILLCWSGILFLYDQNAVCWKGATPIPRYRLLLNPVVYTLLSLAEEHESIAEDTIWVGVSSMIGAEKHFNAKWQDFYYAINTSKPEKEKTFSSRRIETNLSLHACLSCIGRKVFVSVAMTFVHLTLIVIPRVNYYTI